MRLQLKPTRICARDGTSGLLPGNWRTSHESSSTGGHRADFTCGFYHFANGSPIHVFFLKQPFYGDMMGISLATSVNFAVLDFQTNSYHSHGKYMAGLTLSLSLSLAIEGDRCYLDRWVHISFYRFMYVDIHTQTDIHMGVYQTPNTVCRRRFNMSSIWFIYGIFICANTYTCMHTRKEWRF